MQYTTAWDLKTGKWAILALNESTGRPDGDPVGLFDDEQAAKDELSLLLGGNPGNQRTLKHLGGTVKALGDGRVGGDLVFFSGDGDPDLTGEYFTSETDFVIDLKSAPQSLVYYDHGFDPTLGLRELGSGFMVKSDAGVWIEAQLALRDDYEKAVYALAEAGKLGWSSGTAPHLVQRVKTKKSTWIKRWPLGFDASLTATPAEPRAGAMTFKALVAALEADTSEADQQGEGIPPEASSKGAGDASQTDQPSITVSLKTEEVNPVTITNVAPPEQETPPESVKTDPWFKRMQDTITQQGETLDRVIKMIENSPALARAGFSSLDGGTADPSHKSFGDWLISLKRGDHKRLEEIYGSRPAVVENDENGVKTVDGTSGASGGYQLPREYRADLLLVQQQQSEIVSKVTRFPVGARSGTWPGLDNYTAPTAGAGNTAMAGGVTAASRAESGSYTSTDPEFVELEWNVHSISGITYVSKEMNADSPMAIETLLKTLIAITVNAKEEFFILRGSGAGVPLGILNSDAAIGITPATNNLFAYADSLSMLSRFKNVTGKAMWTIHPGILPDLGVFEIGTGGGVWVANMSGGLNQPLLGIPVGQSEHSPQDDNSGCVILADYGAYVLFDKGGLDIAFSEHAGFADGKVAWRFDERLDGMPWMKNAVTLADPQGSYTVSPFVYLND